MSEEVLGEWTGVRVVRGGGDTWMNGGGGKMNEPGTSSASVHCMRMDVQEPV